MSDCLCAEFPAVRYRTFIRYLSSALLMPCCPVYPGDLRNRTYGAVPGRIPRARFPWRPVSFRSYSLSRAGFPDSVAICDVNVADGNDGWGGVRRFSSFYFSRHVRAVPRPWAVPGQGCRTFRISQSNLLIAFVVYRTFRSAGSSGTGELSRIFSRTE